ncbi:hypothetical protein [Aureibacter tunicatorum]|uniref:Uncharacterized protein n=1 Tax=Aureibacter tunicatorum TaxID=866807 RepID=A0AAE3XRW2_9BACT|nr:hypothetical protein [Aureibacter tunicatorum]MDR6242012.1 hypothetical protein [Aureibacter tunicatorum]BDD07143.1 hypothetical protein AUTU_46260 [Aureibacter tunicatorum]BDD07149.1 hypothetical protein AUTU_46320 [Aureibacter tunicatorum]
MIKKILIFVLVFMNLNIYAKNNIKKIYKIIIETNDINYDPNMLFGYTLNQCSPFSIEKNNLYIYQSYYNRFFKYNYNRIEALCLFILKRYNSNGDIFIEFAVAYVWNNSNKKTSKNIFESEFVNIYSFINNDFKLFSITNKGVEFNDFIDLDEKKDEVTFKRVSELNNNIWEKYIIQSIEIDSIKIIKNENPCY